MNADSFWVLENKKKMMDQIGFASSNILKEENIYKKESLFSQVHTVYKMFVPQRYVASFRSVMTVVLALLLTSSGWVASAYAEPGDVLWSAKKAFNSAVEKGELVLTPEEEEAPLHLKYATKQAHILKQVVEKEYMGSKQKEDLIKENSEQLEKKLANADESLKKASVETAAEFVKEVSLKTQEISDVLKQSVQKVSDIDKQGGTIDMELVKGLDNAVIEAQKTSLGMVETVVQKKTEGNLAISEEEKNIIKNHIDVVMEDLKVATEKAKIQVGQLTTIINNTSETNVIENSVASTTVNSSTEIMSSSTSNLTTKETVENVVKKVDETAITLDAQTQVNQKINEGDVLSAIQTVKQLNETVTQTAHEVQKIGKELLPDIQNNGGIGATTSTTVDVGTTSTVPRIDSTTTIKRTN